MRRASVLPGGVAFVGDIDGEEDLVVQGRVEGDLRLGGSLLVDEGGSVRGEIRAQAVTIRGVVVGDAFGSESVRVDEGARMVGDATAPRVKIVEGALFRGQVHMEGDALVAAVRRRPSVRPPAAPVAGDEPAPGLAEALVAESTAALSGEGAGGVSSDRPVEGLEDALVAESDARRPASTEAETVPGTVRARTARGAPRPRMPALGRSRGSRR